MLIGFLAFVTSRRALQVARKNEDQFSSDALPNAHSDGFEQHTAQDPAAVLPSSPPWAALRSDDAIKRVLRPPPKVAPTYSMSLRGTPGSRPSNIGECSRKGKKKAVSKRLADRVLDTEAETDTTL